MLYNHNRIRVKCYPSFNTEEKEQPKGVVYELQNHSIPISGWA